MRTLLLLGLALGGCSFFEKKEGAAKKPSPAPAEPTALSPAPTLPAPSAPAPSFEKDLGAAEAVALPLKELGATAKLYFDCAERGIPRTGCKGLSETDALSATAPEKAGPVEEPKITP